MRENFKFLKDIPDSETDSISHIWHYSCSLCKNPKRTAHLYESGVVLDIEEGQPVDVESLVVAKDGITFLNFYLIENAESVLAQKGGTLVINQDIADLHAQSFHGLPGASVEIGN